MARSVAPGETAVRASSSRRSTRPEPGLRKREATSKKHFHGDNRIDRTVRLQGPIYGAARRYIRIDAATPALRLSVPPGIANEIDTRPA